MTHEVHDWSGSALEFAPAMTEERPRFARQASAVRVSVSPEVDRDDAQRHAPGLVPAAFLLLALPLGVAAWAGLISLLLRLF